MSGEDPQARETSQPTELSDREARLAERARVAELANEESYRQKFDALNREHRSLKVVAEQDRSRVHELQSGTWTAGVLGRQGVQLGLQ